jgi:hypothetical protein
MNNFDWKFYIGYYGDLRKAGINTEQKALEHWVKFGKNENRLGYVGMKKTAIKKQIISTMKISDIKHDVKHDIKHDVRKECLFDWVFYSSIYPDIKRSGLTTQTQVNNHWNTEGKRNGRVCCSNKMTEIFNNNLNKIKNEEMKYIKKLQPSNIKAEFLNDDLIESYAAMAWKKSFEYTWYKTAKQTIAFYKKNIDKLPTTAHQPLG